MMVFLKMISIFDAMKLYTVNTWWWKSLRQKS